MKKIETLTNKELQDYISNNLRTRGTNGKMVKINTFGLNKASLLGIMKMAGIREIPEGNLCKYCGQPNHSTDANLLCEDCRMNFGHTLYSEL